MVSIALMVGAIGIADSVPVAAAGISLDPDATARAERRHRGRAAPPLPGTPDTDRPLTRLREAGVSLGVPLFIRVFKAESELEVWVEREGAFELFATYPICFWSGKLGPKYREGDRQTPEGFYTITESQLHYGGRWRRTLDIGYPNLFDRVNGRTGSLILVHGGCDSIGCFAMTHPVNTEIYDLVSSALRRGQRNVPVHVFPFRMTDERVAAADGANREFWETLKTGYDAFEASHVPPRVSVCNRRYTVDSGARYGIAEPVRLCPEDATRLGSPSLTAQRVPATGTGAPPAVAGEQPAVEVAAVAPVVPRCSGQRASCRKWVALRDGRGRMSLGRKGKTAKAQIRRRR